jgi:hypothetical protein
MFDFELDNTLSCRTIELQKTCKLAFQHEGFVVDLIWDAITEAPFDHHWRHRPWHLHYARTRRQQPAPAQSPGR